MRVICEGHETCLVGYCDHKIPHEKNSSEIGCDSSCHGHICTTRLLIKKDRRKKLKQINESNL